MAEPEVVAKLTLDTDASAKLDEIRRDFQSLNRDSETSQSALKAFGVQFAATFAAVNLMPVVHQVRNFTESLVDVGAESLDVQQKMAGVIAGMTGRPWREAYVYAGDLVQRIDDLGIKYGQAAEDIQAGHEAIRTFLGGTSLAYDVATRSIEHLTSIANVQGLTVSELGRNFGSMANGLIRVQSPIFNLLRSTGIFSKDITKVTKEWQELTQAERVRRLEGAFEKVAENLADAAPTMTDLMRSVHQIGDEVSKAFGKAAIKEFMGQLGMLRGDLTDSQATFEELAAELGKDVGATVAEIIASLRDTFDYIREHADEIRDSIKEGFKFAKETFGWILDHRKELALAGAALALANTSIGGAALRGAGGVLAGATGRIAGGVATAAATRAGAGVLVGGAEAAAATMASGKFAASMTQVAQAGGPATAAGARFGGALASLGGALVAGGPAVWAATAAVGALAVGAVKLYNTIQESEQRKEDVIQSNLKEYAELAQKVDVLTAAEVNRMESLRLEAERAAADKMDNRRVGEDFGRLAQERDEKILKAYVRPMQEIEQAIMAYSQRASEEGLIPEEMAAQEEAVNAAAQLFQTAWQAHDEGAELFIAKMLGKTKDMRNAFIESANMTSEAFNHLAEVVRRLGGESNEEFANLLEATSKHQMQQEAKKAGMNVNFNGGQTFKIEQNFRDQDPDRIAVAFERRFTQAAISRAQAVTSTPFGT